MKRWKYALCFNAEVRKPNTTHGKVKLFQSTGIHQILARDKFANEKAWYDRPSGWKTAAATTATGKKTPNNILLVWWGISAGKGMLIWIWSLEYMSFWRKRTSTTKLCTSQLTRSSCHVAPSNNKLQKQVITSIDPEIFGNTCTLVHDRNHS